MIAPKKRERRHKCLYLYVRRVKGKRYQARLWAGANGGSINLGLYGSEWEAGRAVKAVTRNLAGGPVDPLAIWAAMQPAMRDGHVPGHILPKWVVRAPGGFLARDGRGPTATVLGPFPDPESACRAMMAHRAARAAERDRDAAARQWPGRIPTPHR